MSNVPVQLVVAAFNDEQAAKEALKALKQVQRENLIKIDSAAVLRKDQHGRLHITETADMGGGKGAALGGVAGAVIGVIAGPALLVPAAVGALIGGLTAKLRDSGFSEARLKKLGEGLTPGSSAIVAVVEHRWVAQVEAAMAEASADLLTASMSTDIAGQLEAGHKVAYSAISSEQGFSAARIASGKDEIEGSQVVVDDSGQYASRFVATDNGFVVLAVEETGEGVAVAGLEAATENSIETENRMPAAGKEDR